MQLYYIVVLLVKISAVRAGYNVALQKPASVSSIYSDHVQATANKAVDGLLTQIYFPGFNCFHTDRSANNWWKVDLQATYTLGNIVVYNRQDCCGARAKKIKILVGDSLNDMSEVAFVDQLGSVGNITMPANTVGRYVKFSQQIPEGELLHLCEIQVFADPCASFPCQNGGTCSNTNAQEYTCTCKEGTDYKYDGGNCEKLWILTPGSRTYSLSTN